MITNSHFYQLQLNRFIQKWHIKAQYFSKEDQVSYDIRLHVGKYREVETIGDIDQRQRKGIITFSDIATGATAPRDGDKVYYLDQVATIDGIDPRVEVGEIIGYDLTLRGT